MKKIYSLLVLLFLSVAVFAANSSPSSQNSFTGGGSYCLGGIAPTLSYKYNACSNSFLSGGVTCSIKWYYNTTGTIAVAGSTLAYTESFTCSSAVLGGTSTGTRTYTPTAPAAGTYYYFVQITWSGGCNAAGLLTATSTQTIVANSNPTSISATASPTTLCAGATLNLSGTATGGYGTPTYSWSGPSYGGSSALSPGGFAVTAAGSGVYVLSVAAPGCTASTASTAPVTVNIPPTSVSASNTPVPVCAGLTLTLNGAATNATSYSWTGPGYGGSTALNPAGFTSSIANSGTFTLHATNGCGTTNATTVVNVVTTPPTGVTASAAPTSICSGGNLTLTGTATNAASYAWNGPAGSGYSASALNPPTFTTGASSGGVYTLIATNGCGSTQATTASVNITVIPNIVTPTSPAWGCGSVILSQSWEGGVPGSTGWTYQLNSGTTTGNWIAQTLSGNASRPYPAITSIPDGSSFADFESFSASTGDMASLVSPAFSLSGVTGAQVSFYFYRDGTNYATNYDSLSLLINTTNSLTGARWLAGVCRYTGLNRPGQLGTAASTGWYQYTVTIPSTYNGATNYLFFRAYNGYGDDMYLDNIVVSKPATTVAFTDSYGGGTWSSANTSIAVVNSSTGVVTPLSAGATTITYSVPGCSSTVNAPINVIAATPAIAAAGGATQLCIGSTLALNGTYTGGTWSSSSNSLATVTSTGVVSGVSSGAVTITYSLGCGNAATYALTVVGSPSAITGTNYGCEGAATTLSSSPAGYTWSSSNPLTASVNSATGAVTALVNGTATITYSTGCGTDAYKIYTVNPVPAAFSGVASICTLSVSAPFTDVTTGISSSWANTPGTYGTINPSTGVFSSTSATGVSTITYTVNYASGSCFITAPITVSSASPAGITPASPSVCTGASTTLANSSPGGTWSVDPASAAVATVSASGMVTGLSQGTATISYNACGSVTQNVTVTGYSGTISSNSPICTGGTLSLSSAISPTPAYSWSGPGFTSALAAPTRTSATTAYAGIYSLSVSTGGCARIFTTAVTVSPTSLSVSPASAAFCTGASTSLVATATGVPVVTVLSEGWESGVPITPGTLVDGWNTTAAATSYFSRQSSGSNPTASSHSGTYFNKFNSYSINPGLGSSAAYGAMVSPSFSMLGVNGSVSFWMYREVGGSYASGSYLNEGFKIYVNTSGSVAGATQLGFVPRSTSGTVTGVSGTASPTTSGWYQYTAAIPSTFTGATNYLLFEGISSYGDDCYLDDILLTKTDKPSWSPATRLFTNPALTTLYSAATGTVYAAPATSVTYAVTAGTCVVNVPVTVAAQPAITSLTPSVTSLCAGDNLTLTGTATGGIGAATYTWSGAAIVTAGSAGLLSPVFTPTLAGTNAYNLTLSYSGVNCATAVSSATVTTNAVPGISLGAVPNVCQPSSSTAVSYSSVAGGASLYNIVWGTAAAAAGFTNVTGATLGGSSIAINIPSTSAVGSFDGTISVSNGFCAGSSVYPAHFIIYANPTVTVTSVTVPCVGYAGSLGFTGNDSATVSYTIDGGSVNNFIFAGTTHTLSTGTITGAHVYRVLNAHNPVCTTTVNDTVNVNPTPMAWQGGTTGHETEWNSITNWTCGFVPTLSDDVSISSAAHTLVVLPTDAATVRSLTVNSGAGLTINSGAAINVKGAFTNNSVINGDGKIVLNNTAAQTINGRGTVNYLEVDNSAGATIATGSKLIIGNTLGITSGTLTTNDSLELASMDTLVTARIGTLPSGTAIIGKVQTDQYIQGGFRRYRFLSHPFSDTMSLTQINNYVDITGPLGSANGFQSTASNAPSAFRLDPRTGNSSLSYDPGWKPITKINSSAADTNKLHPGQSMRILFRGAKGEGLGYTGFYGMYTPSAVVMQMKGNVNQGPVTVTLVRGTTDTTNQEYNMIGNPYPSPVDIGTVIYNAKAAGQVTGSAFYIWDPTSPGGGNYISVPIGIGAPAPYYLPANTGFQVRAQHNGATLSFDETNKHTVANNYLFKEPAGYVVLNVYDAGYNMWDKLRLQFNDKAADANDNEYDATKPLGSDFAFYSIAADGHKMSIDARPYNMDKVIPLGIASRYEQEFIIRADNIVVPDGGSIYLHDKLLNKVVEMSAGTEYRFAISKDNMTQGDNRFELGMKPAAASAIANGLSVSMSPNPATNDVKIAFASDKAENVTVRVMDLSGVCVYTKEWGTQQSGAVSVPLGGFSSGIYMVELTQGTQKVTRKLVKE